MAGNWHANLLCLALFSPLVMFANTSQSTVHKAEPKVREGNKEPEARGQGGEKAWGPRCNESSTSPPRDVAQKERTGSTHLWRLDQQAVSSRHYPITGLKRDARPAWNSL